MHYLFLTTHNLIKMLIFYFPMNITENKLLYFYRYAFYPFANQSGQMVIKNKKSIVIKM